MRCDQVQELLYGALSEELAEAALPPAAREHLAHCAACRACRDDVATMSGALRDSDPPALPDGFELALRRRLAQSASEQAAPGASAAETAPRPWFARGLVAAAAMLALIVGSALLWRHGLQPRSPDEVAPSYYRLELAVRSAAPHRDALFEIALPERVRLAADAAAIVDAARGSLRWRSELRPGINELALPLASTDGEQATIAVRITVAGKTLTRRVALRALHGDRRQPRAVQLALAIDTPPHEVLR